MSKISSHNLAYKVDAKFDEADRADAAVGAFALALPTPVFLLVLFFKHEIFRLVSPGASVFLDRACIRCIVPGTLIGRVTCFFVPNNVL